MRWRKHVQIACKIRDDQPTQEIFQAQRSLEILELENGDISEDLARSRKPVGPLETYLDLLESGGISRYRREEYPGRNDLAQAALKVRILT